MKRTLSFLLAVMFIFGLSNCGNQGPTVRQSDRDLEKEIMEKPLREARKEARSLERDGWGVNPGSPPLAKVLENSWKKQYMTTDEGEPRYLVADGSAIAGNQSAGEMQAIELAKLQLAGLIETRIASLVSANIANTQLAGEEAESITEVVQSSKNIIAQELGYVNPAFKIYRKLSNGNVEVKTRVFYDVEKSMDVARKAVRKELKEKLDTNEEDLKKLMGM